MSKESEGNELTKNEFEVTEMASLRVGESVSKNYKDAFQAFQEILDNAVDEIIPGQPMEIRIRAIKNEIYIFNKGGRGLDMEGLKKLFQWGHSEKQGQIGMYGVGGKGAMGYLGDTIHIRCSPAGSNIQYSVGIANWSTKPEAVSQTHKGQISKTDIAEGFFEVKITDLHQGRTIHSSQLLDRLGDIYKPLIDNQSAKITVNGREVKPLEIKYLTSDPNFMPIDLIVMNGFAHRIRLKAGVMEPDQKLKPGLRRYFRGRLIDDEQFFEHKKPSQLPQASRVIGEVHLDNLTVTTNKSSFHNDTREYLDTIKVIHEQLKLLWDKLENLKIENLNKIEDYEHVVIGRAKRVFENILAHTGLITKDMLPGGSHFQRPPDPNKPSRPEPKTRRGPHGPHTGRTAPTEDATDQPNRNRWGALFTWNVVNMGNSDQQFEIINEQAESKSFNINADFPTYQNFKKEGTRSLELYTNNTAAVAIGQVVWGHLSASECLLKIIELQKHLGFYYEDVMTPEHKKNGRPFKGSTTFAKH